MRDKALFTASVIFLVLFFLFVLSVFTPMRNVFSPFIWTVAFIYFFSPYVNWAKKRKIKPIVATVIIYALLVCIVGFLIVIAVPTVYSGVVRALETVEDYIGKNIFEFIGNDFLIGSAGGVYTTIVKLFKNLAVILVGATASFYVLADKNSAEKLKDGIPERVRGAFLLLADDVKVSLDAFFKGQVLIALILFFMVSVFLTFMGIENAVGLGAIAGILDIVPYVGAITAGGIILFVTLITAREKVLWVLLGFLLIQQIENNFITPKVSSDTLKLHPSLTVLVLYIGAFGGFWGILLSVPLACILKKICQRIIESIV